jgi:tetratricopeptide (TPR) repeat protein
MKGWSTMSTLNRAIVTTALTLAVLASASPAQVQQVQLGRPMDANPGVGSGGSNQPVQGYVPVNGNDIVSGNVSGLKYFHGANTVNGGLSGSPIGSSYQFGFNGGGLGTSTLGNFARQSAGSDIQSTPINSTYFLPSATVSRAQGSLYSAPIGGGFDSQLIPRTSVSPVASTAEVSAMDYGTATISRGAIDRMANSVPIQPGAPGTLLSSPLFALRETTESATDLANQASRNPTPNGASEVEQPDDASINPSRGDTLAAQVTGRVDPRIDSQNDELKGAQQNPKAKKIADARLGDSYRTLLEDLKKAEADASAKNNESPQVAKKTELKGTNLISDLDPLTGRPRVNPMLKKSAKATGNGSESGSDTDQTHQNSSDNGLTPRRLEDLPDSTLTAGRNLKPMKSFVIKRPGGETTPADVLLKRAEASLKDGRYLDAVEAYQLALQQDPANGLALVGKSHAELGAGMYQSAANDLKFAFTRNPQMVSVKYEMDNFIPAARQEFLFKDLATLATTKEMGNMGSFLLTYLDYQTGRDAELKTELQRWGDQPNHDSWQTVLQKAWSTPVK